MKSLQDILESLEQLLKEINSPLLSKLNIGLDNHLQRDLITNLDLPEEVTAMYSWRNGTEVKPNDPLGELWIFDFGLFVSLEYAISLYKEAVDFVPKWDKYKFPLYVSGGGEYYLIECDKKKKEYGMIYFHSIGNFDFDIIITKFDSLQTFFLTMIECYQKNAYTFDSDNSIKFNFELECEISKALNPNSDFWKLYPV